MALDNVSTLRRLDCRSRHIAGFCFDLLHSGVRACAQLSKTEGEKRAMIVTIACKYVYLHSGVEIQACVEKRARTHTYMHVLYVKNVCAPVCVFVCFAHSSPDNKN